MQIHLDQFGNFGQLAINVCVTVSHNVAFNNINSKNDTKCNKSRQKPKPETSKQSFADSYFKISYKNTLDMFSNSKICFNVFSLRTYDELLCNWKNYKETRERLALTFQFVVSKLQKLLQNVMQTHLDQFAEFVPFP